MSYIAPAVFARQALWAAEAARKANAARAAEVTALVEAAKVAARDRRNAGAEDIPYREVFKALPAPPALPGHL